MNHIEIRIPQSRINDDEYIQDRCVSSTPKNLKGKVSYILERRSIDARGREPKYVLKFKIQPHDLEATEVPHVSYHPLSSSSPVVYIIGAGPAGYFAALKAIELGIRPIVIERGKDVRARRRDLRAIQQFSEVNPDSNYCFGEGGAGTYSDGKLYTRSKKRGNIIHVLRTLVEHGANSDILIDAHPHIGSNKLPGIIANMRQTIEQAGGQIHFNTRLTDIIIHRNRVAGIVLNDAQEMSCELLILATGHSARDIYKMLNDKNIGIRFKPFALGVRIEHPQALIDEIQYGYSCRPDTLPASSYSLVHSSGEMSVYSFCMCPGGLVVPAATNPGEIVLNGMSLSRRDSPYANAGTVVTIDERQLNGFQEHGPLAGVAYQRHVEQRLFQYGSGNQQAPSQRLIDFLETKDSTSIPNTSYIPGNYSAPLHKLLPEYVSQSLRDAIPHFDKKMRGYLTNEAVVMATESRTSSPVSIPRDEHSLMHPQVLGLYPCGEGAGYAGGIISAAIDGQRVASAIHAHINS